MLIFHLHREMRHLKGLDRRTELPVEVAWNRRVTQAHVHAHVVVIRVEPQT